VPNLCYKTQRARMYLGRYLTGTGIPSHRLTDVWWLYRYALNVLQSQSKARLICIYLAKESTILSKVTRAALSLTKLQSAVGEVLPERITRETRFKRTATLLRVPVDCLVVRTAGADDVLIYYSARSYVIHTTDGTVRSSDVRVPVSDLSKAVDVVLALATAMTQELAERQQV